MAISILDSLALSLSFLVLASYGTIGREYMGITVIHQVNKYNSRRPDLVSGRSLTVAQEAQNTTSVTAQWFEGNPNAYVALCLHATEETPHIREWVLHHWLMGVEKFYISDDSSDPPMEPVIQDFIDAGLVDYQYRTDLNTSGIDGQMKVYNECMQQHGSNHKFIGFIDTDEFIILKKGIPDIPTLLKDYEDVAGLAISWRVFGSDGHEKRPAAGALQSYTNCVPPTSPWEVNKTVKLLANTRYFDVMRSPHMANFTSGKHAVLSNGVPVWTNRAVEMVWDRVILNHYVIRSKEDFEMKVARGSNGARRDWEYFDKVNDKSRKRCKDAIKHGKNVNQLAAALALF